MSASKEGGDASARTEYVVLKLGGEVVQSEHMAAIAADVADICVYSFVQCGIGLLSPIFSAKWMLYLRSCALFSQSL